MKLLRLLSRNSIEEKMVHLFFVLFFAEFDSKNNKNKAQISHHKISRPQS